MSTNAPNREWRMLASLLVAALGALGSGCQSASPPASPLACAGAADCDTGLVCVSPGPLESVANGVCAFPCATASTVCPDGQRCRLMGLPCRCGSCVCASIYACPPSVQAEWGGCGPDAGCADGLVCFAGVCRRACEPGDAGACVRWEYYETASCGVAGSDAGSGSFCRF